ncbi:HEAT repeat domain-containing protein [Miltoncostaea oceani]|uniref:HEAT repeat domain-containing protein n=1 Tax=Miltoncostaea oceani TaxID=2843216 RepID=UPI001C3C462F|nr:HEAT repeat domain-containing protein [Miltoncostaea oceani]
MSGDDWFRTSRWDASERELFAARLARARPESRAQYIRLKAEALLEGSDDEVRAEGARLMRLVVSDHPDDRLEVTAAHTALGRYHEEIGHAAEAAAAYRAALREEGENITSGSDVLLAELILREAMAGHYAEAKTLLDLVLARDPIFRTEQFRYAVARARLADRCGRPDEAAAFALGALGLLSGNRGVSPRHPDVGVIMADDATGAELVTLADRGAAAAVSDLVDAHRDSTGAVAWDWPLIRRLLNEPDDPEEQWRREFEAASADLVEELRAAGFDVTDLSEWSRRRLPSMAAVRAAVPILVRAVGRTDHPGVLVAIVTALTDPRVRATSIATAPIIDLFRRVTDRGGAGDDGLADLTARALAILARDEHLEDVADLVRDPQRGRHRLWLFEAVGRMKRPEAVELCLEMLGDDEIRPWAVRPWAIRALGDLRSERARPALAEIASRPRPRTRNDKAEAERTVIDLARRAIEKLDAARARRDDAP